MSIFSFFGDHQTRKFNYKPVYYNQEEEERRKYFGAVDGSDKKAAQSKPYVPGQYIRQSRLNDANMEKDMERSSGFKRVQTMIGIITLLLVFAVLYYIAKFYELL